MQPRCILINPWIYDFAATNMWSRPLGLLRVAEYLSQFDIDFRLIDCTDVVKTKRKFGTGKYPRQIIEKPETIRAIHKNYARYGISLKDFEEKLRSSLPCDFVIVTSIMSYWYPGVQKAIEIIKSVSPGIPVILGGIYATLYHKHALENSGADYIYRGHINDPFLRRPHPTAADSSRPVKEELKGDICSERGIEKILKNFGLCLNKNNNPRPYYKLGLYRYFPFSTILTGSGCPFKCSYCASSILFNGFVQREPSHVTLEIHELYEIGVRDFAFYDDALLANADSHLKVVLRDVIKSDLRIRFHCPNGLHARFIDDEIAYLMKRSGFKTLRLGLETVDKARQTGTGGKVTTDILKLAVKNLKKHDFTKEQVGVYLMYGLPGQGLEEVKEGIEFLKALDLKINLTEFSPVPGTICWHELKKMGIVTDNIDPLLTNNSVFTDLYSGYDPDALEKLKLDVKQYNSS